MSAGALLLWVAAAMGTESCRRHLFHGPARTTPPSAYDPNWANIAIFIVMVGGLGSLEGVLIGALHLLFADRWFGEYGATYLVVLGPPHSVHGAVRTRRYLGADLQGGGRAVVSLRAVYCWRTSR